MFELFLSLRLDAVISIHTYVGMRGTFASFPSYHAAPPPCGFPPADKHSLESISVRGDAYGKKALRCLSEALCAAPPCPPATVLFGACLSESAAMSMAATKIAKRF
jgi:hypothetical protein